jgi:hypothetical protein
MKPSRQVMRIAVAAFGGWLSSSHARRLPPGRAPLALALR